MNIDEKNNFLISIFAFQKTSKMVFKFDLFELESYLKEMCSENYLIYLTTVPTLFSSKTIINVSLNGKIYSNQLIVRNKIVYGEVLSKSLERIVYLMQGNH